jgi:sulfite oxidase
MLDRSNHELVCRSFDSSGATQPADPREVWNAKGYMNNCWHRVSVVVQNAGRRP